MRNKQNTFYIPNINNEIESEGRYSSYTKNLMRIICFPTEGSRVDFILGSKFDFDSGILSWPKLVQ